jgi:hypothetical protein
VTTSSFDPDSMSVIFSPSRIEHLLETGASAAASAISGLLTQGLSGLASSVTLPCRIYGKPGETQAGRLYLVGMRNADNAPDLPTTHIVGGFGVFMDSSTDHPMDHGEIVATASLNLDDLRFLAANNYRTTFVWGEPDSTGARIAAGAHHPFWPIAKVELLFKLPV